MPTYIMLVNFTDQGLRGVKEIPNRQEKSRESQLSYGSNALAEFRRSASYADRILKGAKPSELPVQTPINFDLVINLKTAKALGLDVPPTLRLRADELIE